jgi:hypothetical protein
MESAPDTCPSWKTVTIYDIPPIVNQSLSNTLTSNNILTYRSIAEQDSINTFPQKHTRAKIGRPLLGNESVDKSPQK